MKKTISLLLALMLLFIISTQAGFNAFAYGWADGAKQISLDTEEYGNAARTDYLGSDGYYYDAYYFSVPSDGTIYFYNEAECDYYLDNKTTYYLYKSNNIDQSIFNENFSGYAYSSGRGMYYGSKMITLSKGNYYLVVKYKTNYVNKNLYSGYYYFTLSFVSNKTGWQKENGKTYYYRNGEKVKYSQTIDGNRYYFNGAGVMQTGWITFNDGKRRYYKSNGIMAKYLNTINGNTYYFNGDGVMHKGLLICNNGDRYYFDLSNGAMYKYLHNIHGNYFYFYGNGKMARNTYIYFYGKNHYFANNGIMKTPL